jgi:hypothetical protein
MDRRPNRKISLEKSLTGGNGGGAEAKRWRQKDKKPDRRKQRRVSQADER